MIKIIETTNAVTFSVRVIPRASRSEIVGEHDGALKVKLASPPVDGAANAELIKLLAKKFGVSKNDIEIVSGETSKNKRIKINNLSKSKFVEVTT
ncbi:MAG: YggU family protein [Pyrinomonadaceae bacterium]|nr:YggU family protein [Pyrinomonadaceae bacterium]MBP9111098.1 YggU family protein [Pyrinomonadaceae bacterium]